VLDIKTMFMPKYVSRYDSVGIAIRYELTVRDRMPILVAERSKARVCGRSLAGVAGLKLAGSMRVCVVCCK
jgi:hypothetical protein